MVRRLKITRKKGKREGQIWTAKDLETDPCDESTGISSHWQDMLENMEIEIVHTSQGTKASWKPRKGRK